MKKLFLSFVFILGITTTLAQNSSTTANSTLFQNATKPVLSFQDFTPKKLITDQTKGVVYLSSCISKNNLTVGQLPNVTNANQSFDFTQQLQNLESPDSYLAISQVRGCRGLIENVVAYLSLTIVSISRNESLALNQTNLTIFGSIPEGAPDGFCQVFNVDWQQKNYIDIVAFSNDTEKVRAIFIGNEATSQGTVIGEFRDLDTVNGISGLNDTQGGLGMVVGLYGQTVVNNNDTLDYIGFIMQKPSLDCVPTDKYNEVLVIDIIIVLFIMIMIGLLFCCCKKGKKNELQIMDENELENMQTRKSRNEAQNATLTDRDQTRLDQSSLGLHPMSQKKGVNDLESMAESHSEITGLGTGSEKPGT